MDNHPTQLEGCLIRKPYQVLMVNRKSLECDFWFEGFDTVEEAKERQAYLLSAVHWAGIVPYVLKLPEDM